MRSSKVTRENLCAGVKTNESGCFRDESVAYDFLRDNVDYRSPRNCPDLAVGLDYIKNCSADFNYDEISCMGYI